jgi:hypothetical protein
MYVRAVKSRGRTFHYWARKEKDAVTGRWVERKIRRLTDDEAKQLKAKTTSMATASMATTQPPNNPKAAPMATPLPSELSGEKTRLLEAFGYRVEYHGEVSVGRLYKLAPKIAALKVGHILIANDGEITCACFRSECEHAQAVRRALRVEALTWSG